MDCYDHASVQSADVLLMDQLWIVMTMAIAFANMDFMVVSVISVKKDSRAANVINANRTSLVTSVTYANQIISIIHCVKVCLRVLSHISPIFKVHIFPSSAVQMFLDFV